MKILKTAAVNFAALCSVPLIALSAQAQIGTQQGDVYVRTGARYTIPLKDINSSTKFFIKLIGNRGYSCVLESPPFGIPVKFGPLHIPDGLVTAGAASFDDFYELPVENAANNKQVISFSPFFLEDRAPGALIQEGSVAFNLSAASDTSASNDNAYLECFSNTQSGSYNTNATPVNVLELRNTSKSPIGVYVEAVASNGSALLLQRIALPARGEQHILLHEIVGENEYGSVQVTFEGPPNALQSSVSRYATAGGVLDLKGNTPLR